jgi:hypothetical protein
VGFKTHWAIKKFLQVKMLIFSPILIIGKWVVIIDHVQEKWNIINILSLQKETHILRSRSRFPRVSKYSKKQTSPPISKSKTLDSLTLGGWLTLGNIKSKSLLPMQATQFVFLRLLINSI